MNLTRLEYEFVTMNDTNYLQSIRKQFEYYKMLGEKTMGQVSDEGLFWQYNDASNSLATIVKHLWGNMRSRWIDFLTSDGEKSWREREAEFENDLKSRAEINEKWEEGWRCLFTAIDGLNDDDLARIVYIRNLGHTVVEAINRQLAHYAYHVGQMVYVGRMWQGDKWESLSIPKGQSQAYNKERFAEQRHKQHFTDNFLNKEQE